MNDLFKQLSEVFDVLNKPIFKIGESGISISSLFFSLVIIYVAHRIGKLVGNILDRSLAKKSVDSGIRDSLARFTRYGILAVGLVTALDTLGFSLNSLAALSAVLMVGIGFGLQNIAQNFISGIILLVERPVKVGDIIHVGAQSGRISDIHVRSTVILTRDDVAVIVPNSKLISEEVLNASFTGNQIRQHVRVGVAYGTDTDLVKETLLKVAAQHSRVLENPVPKVIFEDFGDSALMFDLRFWCSDIWEIDSICSELRYAIDKNFKASGIQIPFPQRDLHIKSKDLAHND